jgi:hypothetical protein
MPFLSVEGQKLNAPIIAKISDDSKGKYLKVEKISIDKIIFDGNKVSNKNAGP